MVPQYYNGRQIKFFYMVPRGLIFFTFFVKNQSIPDFGGRKIKSVPSLYYSQRFYRNTLKSQPLSADHAVH